MEGLPSERPYLEESQGAVLACMCAFSSRASERAQRVHGGVCPGIPTLANGRKGGISLRSDRSGGRLMAELPLWACPCPLLSVPCEQRTRPADVGIARPWEPWRSIGRKKVKIRKTAVPHLCPCHNQKKRGREVVVLFALLSEGLLSGGVVPLPSSLVAGQGGI
jgi:hypothetical protein